jgi:hypothetical protein
MGVETNESNRLRNRTVAKRNNQPSPLYPRKTNALKMTQRSRAYRVPYPTYFETHFHPHTTTTLIVASSQSILPGPVQCAPIDFQPGVLVSKVQTEKTVKVDRAARTDPTWRGTLYSISLQIFAFIRRTQTGSPNLW